MFVRILTYSEKEINELLGISIAAYGQIINDDQFSALLQEDMWNMVRQILSASYADFNFLVLLRTVKDMINNSNLKVPEDVLNQYNNPYIIFLSEACLESYPTIEQCASKYNESNMFSSEMQALFMLREDIADNEELHKDCLYHAFKAKKAGDEIEYIKNIGFALIGINADLFIDKDFIQAFYLMHLPGMTRDKFKLLLEAKTGSQSVKNLVNLICDDLSKPTSEHVATLFMLPPNMCKPVMDKAVKLTHAKNVRIDIIEEESSSSDSNKDLGEVLSSVKEERDDSKVSDLDILSQQTNISDTDKKMDDQSDIDISSASNQLIGSDAVMVDIIQDIVSKDVDSTIMTVLSEKLGNDDEKSKTAMVNTEAAIAENPDNAAESFSTLSKYSQAPSTVYNTTTITTSITAPAALSAQPARKYDGRMKTDHMIRDISRSEHVRVVRGKKKHVIRFLYTDDDGQAQQFNIHLPHGGREANALCEGLRKLHGLVQSNNASAVNNSSNNDGDDE